MSEEVLKALTASEVNRLQLPIGQAPVLKAVLSTIWNPNFRLQEVAMVSSTVCPRWRRPSRPRDSTGTAGRRQEDPYWRVRTRPLHKPDAQCCQEESLEDSELSARARVNPRGSQEEDADPDLRC